MDSTEAEGWSSEREVLQRRQLHRELWGSAEGTPGITAEYLVSYEEIT